ncbi:MAG TPA: septum formation protein Maf [Bacteroidales bacterium]|nr:septum formation protein Maf [Bacteroidales bacterium]
MQFLEKLQQFNIILASQSPRRKELLGAAGVPFTVGVKTVSEDFPPLMPPTEVAMFLSKKKVMAFSKELTHEKTVVIAADTVVTIGNEILNKPSNKKEAEYMLRRLSDNQHQVITGVCMAHGETVNLFVEKTSVWLRKLDDWEIEHYIKNYMPFDKAGAYGIQEWIGLVAISRIEGSYSNVVGLPVEIVYSELKRLLKL